MDLTSCRRWQAVLEDFCTEFAFPPEALAFLASVLRRLLVRSSRFPTVMAAYEEAYLREGENAGFSHSEALKTVSGIAKEEGVPPFSAEMLFYILLSPGLREICMRRGIPEEIFRWSMEDLRCKLYECRQVYGIWGSFVAGWFSRFFRLTLFGIGRLEFAPYRLSEEEASAASAVLPELSLEPGTLVIDTHIPSRGRLPHDAVLDSYRRAADFFRGRYDLSKTGGRAVFHCESWMLDPAHPSLPGMETCGNLLAFQRDYRIFRRGKDPAGGDLWRIFGRMVIPGDTAAVESLPEDTALRRAYKRRLLAGDLPGWGQGVYLLEEVPAAIHNSEIKKTVKESPE